MLVRERRNVYRGRRGHIGPWAVIIGAALVGALVFLLWNLLGPAPAAEETPAPTPTETPEPTPTPQETEPVPAYVVPDELPDWIQEDLLPVNEWSRPGEAMEAINGIVVHYTSNPGTAAWQNRSYFANQAEEHTTYVSSNFIVGLDGEVLLIVPIGEVAYASNKRNSDTLSIEVCHPDSTGKFTDESYASLVRLAAWLKDFYQLEDEDIIRHYDVTGKSCPKYFVDHPDAWAQFKQDVNAAQAQRAW